MITSAVATFSVETEIGKTEMLPVQYSSLAACSGFRVEYVISAGTQPFSQIFLAGSPR